MSRIRTRGYVVERVKRYGRYGGANSNSLDVDVRAMADDVASIIQGRLSGAGEGFYRAQRDYPIAAPTPTLDLDPNFQHLRAIIINPGNDRIIPEYGSDTLIQLQNVGDTRRSANEVFYWIEGPGEDFNGAVWVPYIQRLRITPDLQAGDIVRLTWTTQPLTLADQPVVVDSPTYVDAGQDATITFDWISEPVLDAAIAYVRIHLASRDDQNERAAARAALQLVLDDYLKARAARNQFDSDNPARWQRQGAGGGFVGY